MFAKEFLSGQLESLKPTWNFVSPFSLLGQLKLRQWQYLVLAFSAWTWDAFDFYSIAAVSADLKEYYGDKSGSKGNDAMMLGLSISLVPRFVGAAVFGILSDRYGRKLPLVANLVFLSILELSLAFCTTYTQFLICRGLFGIAMGGIYGNATTTALEDCPDAARGIVAGIYQSGYPFGFLLVTAFWEAFNTPKEGDWKHLFYFAACPPILLIVFRLWMRETDFYALKVKPANDSGHSIGFLLAVKEALRSHWRRILYLVVFMTGCSLLSHGSSDVFGLLIQAQYKKLPTDNTKIQVVAHIGAILGSWTIAYAGGIFGKRICVIAMAILGAVFTYPYCFISPPGLSALAFIIQFFIQGIFGMVPLYLIEHSPPAFRTFVAGTAYNLGVLFASWVPVVESKLGERRHDIGAGETRPQYNKVMAIMLGCTFTFVALVTFLGPDDREVGQRPGQHNDDSDGHSIHDMHVHSVHPMVQERPWGP